MDIVKLKALAMAMANQHVGEGSKSNWEGMLKQWILDGTTHNSPAHSYGTTHNSPAPPKWRGVAQKLFMTHPPPPDYDIDDRVHDISCNISLGHDLLDPVLFEELLDELQAYAEDIDVFQVLHSDNCLSPILRVLYNKYANVRAKGAEVITNMVQINPMNQKLVIQGSGLQLLLYNLTKDPDATSRTKALAAISALLRNNKPAMTVFRLADGYAALRAPLSLRCGGCVGLQRDALNLLQDLLHDNSSDCNTVTEIGLPCFMMHMASSSDDAQVRRAALRCLLVLARNEDQGGGNNGQLVKNDDKLKQVLQKLIQGISGMAPEDLGSARDEIQLVDLLWNACYNEPSSLAEKGLLVLPGENAPVASKLFEPPLRSALAAAEAADGNSLGEKEDPPGLCPPSAATPTYQNNSSSKRRKLDCL